MAIVGLIVATVADILPGDRYVLTRYRTHGTFRVAVWTLALAAVCVAISRMANLQPGYMYGIIGTFTFGLALTRSDEGSMEARGAVGLLILALADLVRAHPVRADAGCAPDGSDAHHQHGPREHLRGRGRRAWCSGSSPSGSCPARRSSPGAGGAGPLLWGAGLALFAHVLMYPVTLAQPSPDPATLATTLVSAGIYGAIAVGFWAAFRYRAARIGLGRAAEGSAP